MASQDLSYWPIFSLLEPDFFSSIRLVISYVSNGTKALIVTKNDMVYTLGPRMQKNFKTKNQYYSLKPLNVPELSGKNIKTLVHGLGSYILALTEDGKVFHWDHASADAERGRKLSNACIKFHFPKEKVIEDIASGSHHFLALTNDGVVFAWGSNEFGQVRCKDERTMQVTQKSVYFVENQKIVGIACGYAFNIVLTQRGELYSWGFNSTGQLGIGYFSYHEDLTKCTNLKNVLIVKVVCGAQHTLALSNEGVVYAWGANNYGQLGLGNVMDCCIPIKIKTLMIGEVLDIAASFCSNISAALARGNRVFVWGQCSANAIIFPTLTSLTRLHGVFTYYTQCKGMHRSINLNENGNEMSLSDRLKEAFDDPITSDLTIQVEDKAIYVHKSILKIRSDYFRAMFQDHWAENNQRLLVHNHYSYEAYRGFLKYLYTDTIDVPTEIAIELLDLANAYIEPKLRKCCEEIIRRRINVDNILQVYAKAVQLGLKDLEDWCFQLSIQWMR